MKRLNVKRSDDCFMYAVKSPTKKRSSKTEYEYVYKVLINGEFAFYECRIVPSKKNNTKHVWCKTFKDLKQAARAVDLKLISLGKEPVNILKRKN